MNCTWSVYERYNLRGRKGRHPEFKCIICGKFISYDDIDKRKVGLRYTPDSEFTIEKTEMWHNSCEVK